MSPRVIQPALVRCSTSTETYWKYTSEPDVQRVLTPARVRAGAITAAQAAHEGQSTLLAIRRLLLHSLFGMLGSLGLWPLGPPQRPLHKDCRVHSSPRLARAFLHRGEGSSSNHSSDIVGRGLSGIESLHVAAMAEQMSIERETAATFLVTQLHAAVLTVVALEVIITVHRYHPHNVLTAL